MGVPTLKRERPPHFGQRRPNVGQVIDVLRYRLGSPVMQGSSLTLRWRVSSLTRGQHEVNLKHVSTKRIEQHSLCEFRVLNMEVSPVFDF